MHGRERGTRVVVSRDDAHRAGVRLDANQRARVARARDGETVRLRRLLRAHVVSPQRFQRVDVAVNVRWKARDRRRAEESASASQRVDVDDDQFSIRHPRQRARLFLTADDRERALDAGVLRTRALGADDRAVRDANRRRARRAAVSRAPHRVRRLSRRLHEHPRPRHVHHRLSHLRSPQNLPRARLSHHHFPPRQRRRRPVARRRVRRVPRVRLRLPHRPLALVRVPVADIFPQQRSRGVAQIVSTDRLPSRVRPSRRRRRHAARRVRRERLDRVLARDAPLDRARRRVDARDRVARRAQPRDARARVADALEREIFRPDRVLARRARALDRARRDDGDAHRERARAPRAPRSRARAHRVAV